MTKRLRPMPPLPRRFELFLFAVVAVVAAIFTARAPAHELALAGLAVPIFMLCAWLGMKRSGQWQSFSKIAQTPARPTADAADVADLP